jgi:PAS domain-containing protein
MPDATDNRVLSQLMLLQGTLDSMPTDESISRFVSRGLKTVPGISSLNVCVRGAVAEKNDLCASCNCRWGETEDNFDYLCKLEDYGNRKCLLIRTVDRLHGFVVFSLNDAPDAFTPYEPYLQNIVNVIAISIDNRRQKQLLEEFNKQLQIEVEHRKQTAEALKESEEQYHSLFENMLNGFAYCKMLYDDEGRPVDFIYLDVNNAFEQLSGLKSVAGKKSPR